MRLDSVQILNCAAVCYVFSKGAFSSLRHTVCTLRVWTSRSLHEEMNNKQLFIQIVPSSCLLLFFKEGFELSKLTLHVHVHYQVLITSLCGEMNNKQLFIQIVQSSCLLLFIDEGFKLLKPKKVYSAAVFQA